MATIEKRKNHSLDDAAAREQAEAIAGKLKQKYGIGYSWQGDASLSFKGKGVTGRVDLSPGAVAVSVDLALMLRPMKGKIAEAIDQQLEKRFPA